MRMRSIARAYLRMLLKFRRGGEAPGMLYACADAVWGVGVVVGFATLLYISIVN